MYCFDTFCHSFFIFITLYLTLILDQLERVFLRLGHAETDEQLQDIISKFLPPVLLKLSSVQEGVRKKVSMYLLLFHVHFEENHTTYLL